MIRTYSELLNLKTFEERFEYLKLPGTVGVDTFGYERYLNQQFYRTAEWRSIRNRIIARDNGCDLGVEGYEIDRKQRVYIHHLNPLRSCDILEHSEYLVNPEYLITTTHRTHNAIHYGDRDLLPLLPKERTPNDTCPWKK